MLITAITIMGSCVGLSASAEETASKTVSGDVNADGVFDTKDVTTLQKWLKHDGTHLADWKAGDFTQDGILNIFDFCAMKRQLTEKNNQESLSLLNGTTVPANLETGKTVSVNGILSSSVPLVSVTAGIYDTAGNLLAGKTVQINANTYNLHELENSLTFQKLPAGNYYYRVTVSNELIKNKVMTEQKFSVVNPVVSDMKLTNGTAVPASISTGKGVSVKGTVTSSNAITSLTAGVYDTAGKLLTGKTVSPNAKTYDLHTLDNDILFNQLPAGSYVYKVIATDSVEKDKVLTEQKFTVTAVSSDMKLTNGTAVPASISAGKGVSVKGTVSSSNTITSLTAGVYDTAGKIVTGKTVAPNAKTYDLHTLDNDILFNTLSAGSYVYKVIATDSVQQNKVLTEQKFTVSTLAASDMKLTNGTAIPTNLSAGNGVSVKGTVSSSNAITSLTVGVYNQSGTFVTGKTVSPNAKTYDLHSLDSAVLFNTLDVGSYTYRVIASDKNEQNKVLTSQAFSVSVPAGVTCIQGIIIANKSYPLPSTYNPGGLTAATQAAFNQMKADAAKEGHSLKVASGYRSYSYQKTLYNNYVSQYGKAKADTFSARPGYSEHQTGMAIDVNNASGSFTGTPAQKWVAANCWKYGFIIRYPQGKESITGYQYESWHIRYLGNELAKKVYDSGLTLEEYLGIDSYYH